MLIINRLNVSINDEQILKGIDLAVKPGEVHALMGPNGAGKSTLAKTLAGHPAYTVTAGTVSYFGKDLLQLTPEDRARAGIFMSFQYPVEIPGLTNINFLKASVNAIRKAQGKPTMDAIDFMGFIREKCKELDMDESFLYRNINEGFSGGEKKRNEILQMIALEPSLSILDETDSGLDIDALKTIAEGVNAMRDSSRAIILVTHYQRLLDYIKPDFIHVLANGTIIKSGDSKLALELEEKGYAWLFDEKKKMNTALKFYEDEALKGRSKDPWLAKLQERALSEFQYRAFPTRHDEDWKYTLLDSFLEHRFTAPKSRRDDNASPPLPREFGVINIHNGEIFIDNHFQQSLPKGVIVTPLLSALEQHADIVKQWLGKLLTTEHGFHALNMATINSGLLLYVPEGVTLEDPLVIANWQGEEKSALHLRHLIIMEEGSSATIIETYDGLDSASYFTNVVTEVMLMPSSKLLHYKIQNEAKSSFHIGHLSIQQGQHSHCESHSLSLGAKLARMDLTLKFLGENASCLLNGLYMPINGQHMDHHTSIHHLLPNCKSNQDYKGVLTGKSRAVFNGKILVNKGAIHTDASQQNKNLLLSKEAEIDTKPQLEIFADDVRCTHGATVGQLDEDVLFYLASRGIEYNDARLLLIQAFAEDNLRLIPNHDLRVWMADLISQQLR